jgi:hypothetical protein
MVSAVIMVSTIRKSNVAKKRGIAQESITVLGKEKNDQEKLC